MGRRWWRPLRRIQTRCAMYVHLSRQGMSSGLPLPGLASRTPTEASGALSVTAFSFASWRLGPSTCCVSFFSFAGEELGLGLCSPPIFFSLRCLYSTTIPKKPDLKANKQNQRATCGEGRTKAHLFIGFLPTSESVEIPSRNVRFWRAKLVQLHVLGHVCSDILAW